MSKSSIMFYICFVAIIIANLQPEFLFGYGILLIIGWFSGFIKWLAKSEKE